MGAPWAVDPKQFFIDHIERYSCQGSVSVIPDSPAPLVYPDRKWLMSGYRGNGLGALSRLEALGLLPRAALDGMFPPGACSAVLERMVREGLVQRVRWERGGHTDGAAYRLTDGYMACFGKGNGAVDLGENCFSDVRFFLSLLPLTHFGSACMDHGYNARLHLEEVRPFLLVWDLKRVPLIAVSVRVTDNPYQAFAALLDERPSGKLWPDGILPADIRGRLEKVTRRNALPYYLVICESFRHMEYCARTILGKSGLTRIPYLYFGYDSLTCVDPEHRSYTVELKADGELRLAASKIEFRGR